MMQNLIASVLSHVNDSIDNASDHLAIITQFNIKSAQVNCKNLNRKKRVAWYKASLPQYFLNLQYFRHSDVHSHNTRFSNYILPLQNQHVFVNKSICFRVPSILNNCPNIIKEKINTHSIKGYSNYIKKYYIEKYSAICQLNHCYSCTNNEIS